MHLWKRPLKQTIAMAIVIVTVMNSIPASIYASTVGQSQEDRVRQRVTSIGPGVEVELKLGSGKKLRGTVGAIGDTEFEIVSKNTPQWVAYKDVTEVHSTATGKKPGMSFPKKFAVSFGVIIGLIAMGSRKPGSLP